MTDPFNGLMLPWQNAQAPMAEVVRWGNFPGYNQSLLAHNNSIPYVLMWIQSRLCDRGDIDWLLLTQAIQSHDQGEPLSGGDEHAGNKTNDKDLQEYLAVREYMASADYRFRQLFMRAFLLQYVRKPQWWSYMSDDCRKTLVTMAAKFSREAVIFEATERLDYLASAVEGYRRGIRNEAETMIDHVLRNQVPKLDALAEEWAPLSAVWSPDLRQQLVSLGSK